MKQIEDVLGEEDDDPYIAVDLVDLLKRATKEKESPCVASPPDIGVEPTDQNTKFGQKSVFQHRIEELKVNVAAFMYMYPGLPNRHV